MFLTSQLSRLTITNRAVLLQSNINPILKYQTKLFYVTKHDSYQQQVQPQQEESKPFVENQKNQSGNKPEKKSKTVQQELEENFAPYRYIYPEFLPDPDLRYRNRIREKLERIDMLARRSNIDIPEFYVGSIMKVGVSDEFAVGKLNEFVGICIDRSGCGLRAQFTLRNVVDNQGVEIMYHMYSPIIQYITVLKLEKRLDERLHYLRDCAPEHSTFPFDMIPELRNPEDLVPLNPIVLKIKPKPWTSNWRTWGLKGVDINDIMQHLDEIELRKYKTFQKQTGQNEGVAKLDLIKMYRDTIPMDEQTEIYGEVQPQLAKLSHALRKQKRKRTFVKPQKTT